MSPGEVTRQRTPALRWTGAAVAILIGFVLGLFGTVFAMLAIWLVGAGATVLGGTALARDRAWGLAVLALGVGLLLGSAVYIALGLIMPHGAASGSGSGMAP